MTSIDLREAKSISSELWSDSRPALTVALLASVYAWLVFATTFSHPGAIGVNYVAPGADWSVMYDAVRMSGAERSALLYDGTAFTAHLNAAHPEWFPRPLQYRPWVYPPTFLLLLWPFRSLSFVLSYALFQVATFVMLAFALAYRAPSRRMIAWIAIGALLSPAAANNAVNGQTAFLVTGLLVLGSRLAVRRPVLAGITFGILTFKPQFGLLIPVALLAAREWRVITVAAGTSLALAVASAIAYGRDTWIQWSAQLAHAFSRVDSPWSQLGRVWGSSVFACAASAGVPPVIASQLQNCASVLSAIAMYAVTRTKMNESSKLAFLLAATFLAAPHSSGYDEILLVVAGMLWSQSLGRWSVMRRLLLLLLWLAPLIGPPAIVPIGRLVPVLVVALMISIWRSSNQNPDAPPALSA